MNKLRPSREQRDQILLFGRQLLKGCQSHTNQHFRIFLTWTRRENHQQTKQKHVSKCSKELRWNRKCKWETNIKATNPQNKALSYVILRVQSSVAEVWKQVHRPVLPQTSVFGYLQATLAGKSTSLGFGIQRDPKLPGIHFETEFTRILFINEQVWVVFLTLPPVWAQPNHPKSVASYHVIIKNKHLSKLCT